MCVVVDFVFWRFLADRTSLAPVAFEQLFTIFLLVKHEVLMYSVELNVCDIKTNMPSLVFVLPHLARSAVTK